MNKTILQQCDANVYEASKERLRYIFNNFDDVICCYSGGKDSMLVVLLCKEVMDELGITRRLKVVFYDEEFIFPETVKAVEDMFALPWVEGFWLCLPLEYQLTLPSGEFVSFNTWEDTRPNVRPLPKGAITSKVPKFYSLHQGEELVSEFIFNKPEDKSKRICQLLGLRAEESMTRQSSITNKWKSGKYCFLQGTHVSGIIEGQVIYDWKVKDVFFYLRNQKVLEINQLYFKFMLLKKALRVGPTLHSRAKLDIEKIKVENPEYYETIVKIFPQIDITARYANSIKQFTSYDDMINKYGLSLKGIHHLIQDTIKEKDLLELAMTRLKGFNKDYLEYDRFKKLGHTYESALRFAFIVFCKASYGKTIMLKRKAPSKKKIK